MSCTSGFSIKNDNTVSLSDDEDQRGRGNHAEAKGRTTVRRPAANCYFFLDFYNVHAIFWLLHILSPVVI